MEKIKRNFLVYLLLRFLFTLTFVLPASFFTSINIFTIIFALIMFQLSHDLALLIMLPSLKENIPKSVEKLSKKYKVAILYVCKNEFSKKSLISIKNQTYNIDVYVLDASDKEAIRNNLKKLCKEFGFNYINTSIYSNIKRKYKSGKAWDLNFWINKYYRYYDAIIIADSDSIFPEDFVESMLKYLDHPENRKVVIFQAISLPYYRTLFGKLISSNLTYIYRATKIIYTNFPFPKFFGHNALIRCDIFEKARFNPKYVSEDWKFLYDIKKLGYDCKIVDVISYEQIPENLVSYVKRSLKWFYGKIEHLSFIFSGSAYIYYITFFLNDIQGILHLILPILLLMVIKACPISIPMLFYGFSIIFLTILIQKAMSKYLSGEADIRLLEKLTVCIITSLYIIAKLSKRKFIITPKESTLKIDELFKLYLAYYSILICLTLANPLVAIINIWWMFPLYLIPMILIRMRPIFEGKVPANVS